MSMLDPVVLFFLLGVVGGLSKSGLKIPDSFYNVLSIYLLLSIGIKGGIELYHSEVEMVLWPAIVTVILGILICILAWQYLERLGKFSTADAIAMAAHYGSVSAVTFAVVLSFLRDRGIAYEEFVTVLLVLMEIPAIAFSIFVYKIIRKDPSTKVSWRAVGHEIFLGKSMLLLLGGMMIGFFTGWQENEQLHSFFFGMFKGFLAIFMLEMGVVTSSRLSDLKKVGPFLIVFGITMPLIAGTLGVLGGWIAGMSQGGTIILATLAASASYIAAPAAIKMAIPEANPTLYLTTPLGITFPFNIIAGISIYYHLTEVFFLSFPPPF
jgi:hypothetical protein